MQSKKFDYLEYLDDLDLEKLKDLAKKGLILEFMIGLSRKDWVFLARKYRKAIPETIKQKYFLAREVLEMEARK